MIPARRRSDSGVCGGWADAIPCRPTLEEDGLGAALTIRRDLIEPDDSRRLARRERDRRTAARMPAIANALEGMTRAEAARLAGLERQALRDAVLRFMPKGSTDCAIAPSRAVCRR